MQVKDVMLKEVVAVKHSTTLKQLLEMFDIFHTFPLIPVVEENNRLIGILSYRSLISVFHPQHPEILETIPFLDEEKEDIFKTKLTKGVGDLLIVEDIFIEKDFVSIPEDAQLECAYDLMKLHLKEQFPVVDNDRKLVGLIGMFDIVREVFRQNEVS